METSLWFATYLGVRVLSFIIMSMLLYPALRSAKHRTLISLYILECLSDINTIVFLSVEAPTLKYTDTSNYTPDALCIFSAYAGRFIAVYRSALLLGLCTNLWMAVHKPNINADREWFKWYILSATILGLAGSLPVYFYAQHTMPGKYAETLYSDFTCAVNTHIVSTQVVTGVTFSLNIISMLLLFHTTFDVLRHKFKVNAASSMDIERALQSRIVVRMMFCSTIAVVVVLWLDLQSMISVARNTNDNTQNPTNSSMNIFLGVISAMFYFLAFGTTSEFAKTYCCCLVPPVTKCLKRRRKANDSYFSQRHTGIVSLPRINLSLPNSLPPEGEWQELESIHENVDHENVESKKYLSGYP